MLRIRISNWLTSRRITAHAAILAACLWSVYAFNMSAPGIFDRNGLIKGADFLHFYVLGSLALAHRGDLLYDMPGQSAFLAKLLPPAGNYAYVPLYGPQLAVFWSPLARLPYLRALTVWLLLNCCFYGFACYASWRCCPRLRQFQWTTVLAALAFPGFFHLIVWGQTAGVALLCLVLAYLALRADKTFLAGLAIGSLIFKPQLGVAAAVVFLALKKWKLVASAVCAACAQLLAGWFYFGSSAMHSYWKALLRIPAILPQLEPRPYQTDSLRSFFSMLVPVSWIALGLYALSAAAVLILLTRCWSVESPLDLKFSALLLATVLVAPHLTIYDVVILAPAFLLLSNAIVDRADAPGRAIKYLLYLSFPLFLAGPLAQVTHLQLSVIAVVLLFWLCCDLAGKAQMREPLARNAT